MSPISTLTTDLTASLRRPCRKTLTLLDKALSYLSPFESVKARAASPYEKHELLELLHTHRLALTPYIDIDRIETNLRRLQYS